MEAEDKVEKLYKAESDYYDNAFGLVLGEMNNFPWGIERVGASNYRRPKRFLFEWWGRFSLWRFIRRSRFRAKMRWPKGMVTVTNWVDYLLAKIERTQGIKLELTEKERRHPLLYGWKYFFLLKRKKALK